MWEQHDCTYDDMGDDEVQQCFDEKKIASIDLKGASIRTIDVDGYMTQKLQSINMPTAGNGTRFVVLDTLKMPHFLWGESIDERRKELETNFPDIARKRALLDNWVLLHKLTRASRPIRSVTSIQQNSMGCSDSKRIQND
jgi:hypothetical protein